MTKRYYYILFLMLCSVLSLMAQERTVQNRPYCDLRPLHFGVVVGTNMQDMKFLVKASEDDITCDQDRWDIGFHVGVLAEFRLDSHFAFRIAPQMYFGNRHILFRNFSELGPDKRPMEARQDMKTSYVLCSLDLIYAAQRFNNHRPYLMAGLSPGINLSTKENDYLQLKRTDIFFEAGLGCDFYLPFFKLRPELKFMYSLGNSLNKKHVDNLRDPNMVRYAGVVNSANSRMVALTFYFE